MIWNSIESENMKEQRSKISKVYTVLLQVSTRMIH